MGDEHLDDYAIQYDFEAMSIGSPGAVESHSDASQPFQDGIMPHQPGHNDTRRIDIEKEHQDMHYDEHMDFHDGHADNHGDIHSDLHADHTDGSDDRRKRVSDPYPEHEDRRILIHVERTLQEVDERLRAIEAHLNLKIPTKLPSSEEKGK